MIPVAMVESVSQIKSLDIAQKRRPFCRADIVDMRQLAGMPNPRTVQMSLRTQMSEVAPTYTAVANRKIKKPSMVFGGSTALAALTRRLDVTNCQGVLFCLS